MWLIDSLVGQLKTVDKRYYFEIKTVLESITYFVSSLLWAINHKLRYLSLNDI